MKILMVSMNSIHFRRWTNQLEDAGHEVYWFDILGAGGHVGDLDWVSQKTDWRLKFKRGRYFFKRFPILKGLLENKVEKAFEHYLKEVQPDIVHSFVLYMSCAPILEVMKRYGHIKWLYSAWGNDLFFYQHIPKYKKEIDAVLPHLDYMFADCKRDLELAKTLGFRGETLDDFPGGGGYHLEMIEEPVKEVSERTYILVKGYQGEKHRGLNVLKALEKIKMTSPVIFFSTDDTLFKYYESSERLKSMDIKLYGKNDPIAHKELCRLMNRSIIYVGNNVSDGMPNTMLEAICFGAFPIQSNPGGASAEIIEDGQNGLLIKDCEDVTEIANKIQLALQDRPLLEKAFQYNMELRKKLEYNVIKKAVLKKYEYIEAQILANNE